MRRCASGPPARASVHPWVHVSRRSPSICGTFGPYASASRSPTGPRARNASARFTATVDLPTPPLPLPTAMTKRAGLGPVDLSRIEDPLGVERVLDLAHEVERVAMFRAHVRLTYRSGAVLAGDRAADLDREAVQPVRELVGAPHFVAVGGVDQDRRVDVPVAEMAVEDDRDAQLGADLASAADG